jgi:hypothetical protein
MRALRERFPTLVESIMAESRKVDHWDLLQSLNFSALPRVETALVFPSLFG